MRHRSLLDIFAHPLRSPATFALLALLVPLGGCGDEVLLDNKTPPPVMIDRATFGPSPRIDLLLAIDNSRSMGDKIEILAKTIPDLVRGFANPPCVDETGLPVSVQPTGPFDFCPAGSQRVREPVLDMHIGVISSSLGGHGSDICLANDTTSCPGSVNTSINDKGHLLSRSDACGTASLPTYSNKGFLAWDPAQSQSPPGSPELGDLMGKPGVLPALRDMVLGVGQIGCGFESQLESWYRFLVDPEPYQSLQMNNGKVEPVGIDDVLLAQRKSFLRPDSFLIVLMLSDENDCSIKEFGQYYYAAQLHNPNGSMQGFHLPRARAECATDPNDPCCLSCGQVAPAECPPDPGCQSNPTLSDAEDPPNLRCFDQKRRFGIDFLYPVDRYTTGLTHLTVPNRAGELVPNPIFSDLDPNDDTTYIRASSMVLLAGLVGVPWQDIARDPNAPEMGFKSSDELRAKTASGDSAWDIILGDPAKYVPPADPLMIESVSPRTGQNPITGDPIAPIGSPNGTNPINGHEYTASDALQYACIFPLAKPRDCSDPANLLNCECDPTNDSPLCEPNPNDSGKPTLQARAKAYPGLRQLAVLESVHEQGFVGSVCPAQINDPAKADFAYRPVLALLQDRLTVSADGTCSLRVLAVDGEARVACTIAEARNTNGHCGCSEAEGRRALSAENQSLLDAIKQDPLAEQAGWDCVCEIVQPSGQELAACQNDPSEGPVVNGEVVDGWCYVDVHQGVGNPEIVKSCPEDNQRIIRFVGAGKPKGGSTVFLSCATE